MPNRYWKFNYYSQRLPTSVYEFPVIRSPTFLSLRITSSDSVSFHGSVQGESDSEPEGLISTLHSTLDSLLSSDCDSDSDNSDIVCKSRADKPVFLTARGPVEAGIIRLTNILMFVLVYYVYTMAYNLNIIHCILC